MGDEESGGEGLTTAGPLLWAVETASAALLFLSLAGYLGAWHRYFELLSHFKLQYLFAALGCLLFFIVRRPHAWAGIALVSVALNACALAPWYVARPPAPVPGAELKVLLANLNYGNRDHLSILSLIGRERPDIVVCQEVTESWSRALAPALVADYPFALALPATGGSGIALYSRWPLVETRALDLGMEGRPGIFARVQLHGREVSLLTLHPPTPLEESDFVARNRQFTEAAAFARQMPGPKIMVGDLNNTLWSPFFARLTEESGLRDVRAGRGVLPTWPTQLPPMMRIPIDHCLVSPEVGVADVRTGPRIGSDHLPLIVRLTIP